MKLFIKDRLYFPQLLPKKNSYMDFNLKKSIVSKVSISEEELKKFGIKEDSESGTIQWDVKADKENPLEVTFSADELAYLRKGCEALSDETFPDDFWSVVEKVYSDD